jgi:hypothetical protein
MLLAYLGRSDGILLEAAVGLPVESEIALDKALAGGFANRKGFSGNFDGVGVVQQSLAPDFNQGIIECLRKARP